MYRLATLTAIIAALTIFVLASLPGADDPSTASAGACSADAAEVHHAVDRMGFARSIHQLWLDNPHWYAEYGLSNVEWDANWVVDYDRTLAVIAALYWRCGS